MPTNRLRVNRRIHRLRSSIRADAGRGRVGAQHRQRATTVRAHAALRMLMVALIACCAQLAIAADAALPLAGTALRDALLRGGYVLYFRHAATDFGQNDDKMT